MKKIHILYRLLGYCEMRVSLDEAEDLLNLCMRYGFVYHSLEIEDKQISFVCSLYTSEKIMAAGRVCGITVRRSRIRGLPRLLYRYRRRYGLMVGLFVMVGVLYVSSQYVWDIRITGNETVREEIILAELAECGFAVGSYLPSLDVDALQNRVLIASDDLAWISVNMRGTVANVEVIERKPKPPAPVSRPANLVASQDAVIEILEVFEGNVCVKIGDTVRRGDLLVSGLYDSQTVGYRYTRAGGRVLGRTVRHVTVEIPFACEKKSYTGRKFYDKSIKFFAKTINVFTNSRNLGSSCDIIRYVDRLRVPGGALLPIGMETTLYREYETVRTIRTHEEAMELAYARLAMQLSELLGDAELIRKSLTSEITDTSYRLHCEIVSIEDIARVVEFDVTPAAGRE